MGSKSRFSSLCSYHFLHGAIFQPVSGRVFKVLGPHLYPLSVTLEFLCLWLRSIHAVQTPPVSPPQSSPRLGTSVPCAHTSSEKPGPLHPKRRVVCVDHFGMYPSHEHMPPCCKMMNLALDRSGGRGWRNGTTDISKSLVFILVPMIFGTRLLVKDWSFYSKNNQRVVIEGPVRLGLIVRCVSWETG